MPLWTDMPGDITIARTGVQLVPVLTTVCLELMTNEIKFKPSKV